MIAELQDAADFLNDLDDELTDISKVWTQRSGVSHEVIEAETQKYLRGQNA
jgi:hypothetical protein